MKSQTTDCLSNLTNACMFLQKFCVDELKKAVGWAEQGETQQILSNKRVALHSTK